MPAVWAMRHGGLVDSYGRPGRVVAVLAATHLAAGTGFYAVVAHLALHLRQDVGLLAVGVGLVLSLRTGVQYALYLPMGALTDRWGPARAGAAACFVRAGGFALLAVADSLSMIAAAAVLVGVGGSLFMTAGQAILAVLPGGWPRRGFAWHTAAGQISAVAGPVAGLLLLDGAGLVPTTGFTGIAWLAAGTWAVSGLLLYTLGPGPARLRRWRQPTPEPLTVRAALRHRGLVRLAIAASPVTLLITQVVVVVPLIVTDRSVATTFLTTGAALAALTQLPWCRPLAVRSGLGTGFAGFAVAYALLIPAAAWSPGSWRTALLVLSAAVYGVAHGLLLPALFHHTRLLAPAGAAGTYFGVRLFVAGVAAFAGGVAVGFGFDNGRPGILAVLLTLCVSAVSAAAATTRWQRFADSVSDTRSMQPDKTCRGRSSGSELSRAPTFLPGDVPAGTAVAAPGSRQRRYPFRYCPQRGWSWTWRGARCLPCGQETMRRLNDRGVGLEV